LVFVCEMYSLKPARLRGFLHAASEKFGRGRLVLVLVHSGGFLSGDKTGDYSFSMLLTAHSSSECVNELNKVYALLGILPEEAPSAH
jgi:hypothetical protein